MISFRRAGRGFGFTAARGALAVISLAGMIGLARTALAQDDAADPPTRVGRIAFIDGNVSFHPSPDDPWAAASVNYPIAQAGQIYADPQSRAEIGLGEARIQLAGGTEVDIVQLDDQNVVVSVPQGRIDLYLRDRHPEEHYFVETPRGNVELVEDGRYRVVAGSADEPTRIAAFRGQAAIAETQAQLTVNRGEEAVISPTDPPSFDVATATEDAFDRDGEERERRAAESVSYKYVSPDMPGAAELAEYGEWRTDADYGAVWIPAGLPADWAPYRHGHWAFVAPWGYTWIDDAPWGFAPFHYGRWALIGGAWSWIPGEVVVHPVYAPALVTFVGDPAALVGGAVGVSIGWIPLGPREVWVPPYHVSIDYIRHGNIAYVPTTVVNNITVNNITVIHEKTVFVNQQHVTVVPQQAFATAQPIQRAAVKIEPAVLTRPIVAATAPARVLPPPAPAAKLAVPTRQVAPPPPASVPIAHPIAPTNNLPKLAPAAPIAAARAPAPAALPKPPVPAAPAQAAPGIRPPEPAPAARPGVPAAPAAPAPARPPEPQQARPAAPPVPPAPQARPGVPPAPAQQARPAAPPAPAPQARPAPPPAPAPQARPAAPPAPAARPVPPAPPPQARPPQPPAPAARPAPPPAPQARPAAPPAPQARPGAAPPAPQARPQAPPPPAHPPAPPAQPPKKDDKNEKKPNEQQPH